MPFPNKDTQWKPGASPNPSGRPKGRKSLSTMIREVIEDDKLELKLKDGKLLKGPGKAMVAAMVIKANAGDVPAATFLAKYGYGDKLDVTSNDQTLTSPTIVATKELADDFASYLKDKTKAVEPPVDN